MTRKRTLNIIGIFYIILGFVILLTSFKTITGFAIIENLQTKISSILGLIVVSIGLSVSIVSRNKESELEKRAKISVFNAGKGKESEENYMMTDPELYFEGSGAVSLGRFKREINQLKKGDVGEELVKIIRGEYEPPLRALAESNDREKASIAGAFLRVLDPSYNLSLKEEKSEQDYRLTSDEREDIKAAFRGFDGLLDQHQRNTLKRYNLVYAEGKKHKHIIYTGTGYKTSIQRHLGKVDPRTGLNTAMNIIELIETGRKHDLEKKSKKNEES